MADEMRFRSAGRKRITTLPVASATVIEVGDICWQDRSAGEAKPASDFTWTSDRETTSATFRRDFAGVAMGSSDDGETHDIPIAQAGRFVFDCASASFEIGDLVGPDDNATPDGLLDQQVIGIGENEYGAIGKVAKRYGSNTSHVEVEVTTELTQYQAEPQMLNLGTHDITASADVVTDWPVEYPFKLVAVRTINVVSPAADTTLTIDNGSTSLDDTHATGTGSAGAVVRTEMDDASGNDHYGANDTLSVVSDGAAATGEVAIQLEIKPFLHEGT